jgi:hypothetical protein
VWELDDSAALTLDQAAEHTPVAPRVGFIGHRLLSLLQLQPARTDRSIFISRAASVTVILMGTGESMLHRLAREEVIPAKLYHASLIQRIVATLQYSLLALGLSNHQDLNTVPAPDIHCATLFTFQVYNPCTRRHIELAIQAWCVQNYASLSGAFRGTVALLPQI